ncbi:MAG TPA: tetratricopeptide repeat protein, partial [Chitinophagaceae bacterium]|nr:tetratricopeptide repeat protein [Chitinophagaceae bacterium]
GNISEMPMEGINRIREVLKKDSANVYAQMMLVKGSLMTKQYNNAISRLQTVNRIEPDNVEAILLLAEVYEKTNDKMNAVKWYQQSLRYIKREDVRTEIGKRIEELKK